jgi:rare lipoprotein A
MKKLRIALAALGLLAATVANAQQPAPAAAEPAKAAAPAPAVAAAADASSGTAAWYGRKFAGRKTASGQRLNPHAMTAAHPSLPFGTRVKVTNTRNKRSVVLTINDRLSAGSGRILDVTQAAAKKLGFIRSGLTEVTLEVVGHRAARRHRK